MSTGLLIRDFFKEERELRYNGSGSIRFSEIEHNAYRLSLTLEITHLDAPRYANFKTLPENTHYGYVTTFKGSTVVDSIAIKYPKFRVFDIRNDAIWHYHQASEVMALNDDGLAQALKYYLTETLQDVSEDFLPAGILRNLLNDTSTSERGLAWATEMLERAESVGESIEDTPNNYRAYPIASPFPDVAKFLSDVPVSFLWRLESWYLVNPAVYIVDNPTDSGDATEGESEYPEPEGGDGDGDGDEFPPSDDADPDSDPRDYGDGNTGYPGGINQVVVRVEVKALSGGCGSSTVTFIAGDVVLGDLAGPFEGFSPGNTYVCSPEAYLGVRLRAAGQTFGPFFTGAGIVSARAVQVFYN